MTLTAGVKTTSRQTTTTKTQLLHDLEPKKVSTIGLRIPSKTKTLITNLDQGSTGTTWMMRGTKKGIMAAITMQEATTTETKVGTTPKWRAEDLQQV